MNVPGFTAEAALDKIENSYLLTLAHPDETGLVVPQFCRCAYIEGEFVCWCSPIRAHL
jgi:hypothetical protein